MILLFNIYFWFHVHMGIKNDVQFRDNILFKENQNDRKIYCIYIYIKIKRDFENCSRESFQFTPLTRVCY